MARKRLGTMLIEAGLLTEQGLRVALNEQTRWGGSLGRTVVEMKLVSEVELVRVLAEQLKVAPVDLDKLEIPQSVLAHVPPDFADLYAVIPYAQPMKFLDVAMADPTNATVIDELRMRTKLNIRPALAGPKMLERAIGKYYGRGFSRFYGDIPIALDTEGPALEIERSDHEPALDDLLIEDGAVPVRFGKPRLSGSGSSSGTRSGSGSSPSPSPSPTPPPPPKPKAAMPPPPTSTSAEIAALQRRVRQLETHADRAHRLIAKLITVVVEHNLTTRDEIVALLDE